MQERRFQPQQCMTSEGRHSLRLNLGRDLLRTAASGSQGPFHPRCPRKWGFPGGSAGKESACQCRRHGFNPRVGKIPWRRKWKPNPVFLPEKSYGQRSLVALSPWGHKELDRTELSALITEGIVASPKKGKGEDPRRYASAHGVDKIIKKRQSHQGKCKWKPQWDIVHICQKGQNKNVNDSKCR